jgi:hypothetical protein
MRSQSLLAATALLALAASPAVSQNSSGNSQGGNSQGGSSAGSNSQVGNYKGGNYQGGNGVPAPGPVAGVGLGYLVLVGGYYVVRRWRKQNTGE